MDSKRLVFVWLFLQFLIWETIAADTLAATFAENSAQFENPTVPVEKDNERIYPDAEMTAPPIEVTTDVEYTTAIFGEPKTTDADATTAGNSQTSGEYTSDGVATTIESFSALSSASFSTRKETFPTTTESFCSGIEERKKSCTNLHSELKKELKLVLPNYWTNIFTSLYQRAVTQRACETLDKYKVCVGVGTYWNHYNTCAGYQKLRLLRKFDTYLCGFVLPVMANQEHRACFHKLEVPFFFQKKRNHTPYRFLKNCHNEKKNRIVSVEKGLSEFCHPIIAVKRVLNCFDRVECSDTSKNALNSIRLQNAPLDIAYGCSAKVHFACDMKNETVGNQKDRFSRQNLKCYDVIKKTSSERLSTEMDFPLHVSPDRLQGLCDVFQNYLSCIKKYVLIDGCRMIPEDGEFTYKFMSAIIPKVCTDRIRNNLRLHSTCLASQAAQRHMTNCDDPDPENDVYYGNGNLCAYANRLVNQLQCYEVYTTVYCSLEAVEFVKDMKIQLKETFDKVGC